MKLKGSEVEFLRDLQAFIDAAIHTGHWTFSEVLFNLSHDLNGVGFRLAAFEPWTKGFAQKRMEQTGKQEKTKQQKRKKQTSR